MEEILTLLRGLQGDEGLTQTEFWLDKASHAVPCVVLAQQAVIRDAETDAGGWRCQEGESGEGRGERGAEEGGGNGRGSSSSSSSSSVQGLCASVACECAREGMLWKRSQRASPEPRSSKGDLSQPQERASERARERERENDQRLPFVFNNL
eukprot:1537055-Rhodomonas_salina.1